MIFTPESERGKATRKNWNFVTRGWFHRVYFGGENQYSMHEDAGGEKKKASSFPILLGQKKRCMFHGSMAGRDPICDRKGGHDGKVGGKKKKSLGGETIQGGKICYYFP